MIQWDGWTYSGSTVMLVSVYLKQIPVVQRLVTYIPSSPFLVLEPFSPSIIECHFVMSRLNTGRALRYVAVVAYATPETRDPTKTLGTLM